MATGMGIPPAPGITNKVVVAYLDGRREKGYVFSFSTGRDSFQLLPSENPLEARGIKVDLKELKAVFFVKDFVGNSQYQDNALAQSKEHGRKIEVTFRDGEKIVGKTHGYNPQNLGFFMQPVDANSNSLRIFVVNANVSAARFIT